ncbi:MAG: diacylglycerol kinase family protein [Anaerolineae bacterium]|nr:diacylglycerol kinase family protein [Anaerolineae bacterium]
MDLIRSRIKAFGYAFSGLFYVLRTQKNSWIHLAATILVISLAWWLELPILSWTVIILAIGMVWSSEIMNTSLEAIVDLASPQNHPLAKVGKDVGAAAVLLAAGSAFIIGILLIGPPLIDKLHQLGE